MTIEVGATLAHRYHLTATLGKGGMGEVFAAREAPTGREVAIKIVRRANADEVLAARLEREALAAGRIHSAYVPRIFDIARTDDGELFLVMQRLHGQSLAERLRLRGGCMPWDEVRPIVEDVLLGLIDAHAAGVVHRDLKPGNIFLERLESSPEPVESPLVRERAMILDFGVAKIELEDSERLTTTGEALGTIAYMAPEQIRGASRVDARADLYAIAMVAFEALSGQLAHDGQGQVQIVASKLERAARKLSDVALVPVPEGLEALLAKALSRKAEARPASAREMLAAWRALGPATVMPRARAHSAFGELPTEVGMTAPSTILAGPTGTKLGLGLAALGLLIAGVALFGALQRKPAPARPAPPEPATFAPPATTAASSVPTITIPTVELEDVDAGAVAPVAAKSIKTASRPPPPAPTIKPVSTLPPISTKPRY